MGLVNLFREGFISLLVVCISASNLYSASCYTAASGNMAIQDFQSIISSRTTSFTNSIEDAHLEAKRRLEKMSEIEALQKKVEKIRGDNYRTIKEIIHHVKKINTATEIKIDTKANK